MPARKVVVPAFGAHLRALRGDQSRAKVCHRIEELVGHRFDRSTLMQYERGTVGSPDPLVLWALARIYLVDHATLLERLYSDRVGRPAPAMAIDPTRRALLALIDTMGPAEVEALLLLLPQSHRRPRRRYAGGQANPAVATQASSRPTTGTGTNGTFRRA